MVNAHTLAGGYAEIVADGVLYRIIECDDISIFADRGVYIGIHEGYFPNNRVFLLDERTGELSVNPEYDGFCALFDLPLDKSLADPVKAQVFLDDLFGDDDEQPAASAEPSDDGGETEWVYTEEIIEYKGN
jgi:hypothetical protein